MQQFKEKKVEFALCESCYWTASLLDASLTCFDECPVCLEKTLEVLPIARNELYRFAVTEERGVEVYFGLKKKKKK